MPVLANKHWGLETPPLATESSYDSFNALFIASQEIITDILFVNRSCACGENLGETIMISYPLEAARHSFRRKEISQLTKTFF